MEVKTNTRCTQITVSEDWLTMVSRWSPKGGLPSVCGREAYGLEGEARPCLLQQKTVVGHWKKSWA